MHLGVMVYSRKESSTAGIHESAFCIQESSYTVDRSLLQLEFMYKHSEPRNRFQGMNSVSLCSLAGRYDNPIPPRFLAPIDTKKFQLCIQDYESCYTVGRSLLQLEFMCKMEVLNVWNYANVRNHSTFVSDGMVRSLSTYGCTEMHSSEQSSQKELGTQRDITRYTVRQQQRLTITKAVDCFFTLLKIVEQ